MKKIIVILSLLFIFPITAFAAETPVISKLELANDKGVITYNGEVELPQYSIPAYAVTCKLYNSKDEEVDILSTEVTDLKFNGSFTVVKNDTYKVSCANYESGTIKSETIEIKDVVNPKTGDNVYVYCLVLALCLAAAVIAAMYPRFLKKVKAKRATKKTNKKK